MSHKFKTEEDYLRSGRVPFVFHDPELGDVTVYAYKQHRANYEFKRMAARLRKQKAEIEALTISTRKQIEEYRRKQLAEQRRIESALGIIPLNNRSLFDERMEDLNDAELNIMGVGTNNDEAPEKDAMQAGHEQPVQATKKRKYKKKAIQTTIKFDSL